MFYSDWGNKLYIGKCGMDGFGCWWFVISKFIGWFNGLIFCYIIKRLFWVDVKLDVVEFCDWDGGNCV